MGKKPYPTTWSYKKKCVSIKKQMSKNKKGWTKFTSVNTSRTKARVAIFIKQNRFQNRKFY